MGITAAVATVAVGAYSANRQASAAKKMSKLGKSQAARQEYYDSELRALRKDPSKITSDPGYQESMSQGIQAVERAGTLSGFTGSGNAAIALQKFGQSFASSYLMEQEKLLASLSGANVNPANAMAAGGAMETSAFESYGKILASLGYTLGGLTSGSSSGGGSGGFGTSTSIPGTMNTGGGYIVNVPGYAGGSYSTTTGREVP